MKIKQSFLHRGKFYCFNVIKEGPKIFNSAKCDDGTLLVGPISRIFFGFVEPQCPVVLKKVGFKLEQTTVWIEIT